MISSHPQFIFLRFCIKRCVKKRRFLLRKKLIFYTELAYALGLLILALGTAFMEHADLGISMVVAPSYLIHLKVSQYLPFYSFGMSEYVLQAFVIIFLAVIMRRFKRAYLFSFVTAVLYGFMLDGMMLAAALLPTELIVLRIVFWTVGLVLCSIGVALLFNAYIPPAAYELFVKELAAKLGKDVSRVKLIYDLASCIVGVALSFIFFGFLHFEGVKLGTVICAIVNGPLIGLFFGFFVRSFDFRDGFPKLKAFFE